MQSLMQSEVDLKKLEEVMRGVVEVQSLEMKI